MCDILTNTFLNPLFASDLVETKLYNIASGCPISDEAANCNDNATTVLGLAMTPLPLTVRNIKAASILLRVDNTHKSSAMISSCAEYLINESALTKVMKN